MRWPVDGQFKIAHGSLSEIDVVQVTITDKKFEGRGECRPYARYGETVSSVLDQIGSVTKTLEHVGNASELQNLLPAGAARNALDCAFWDLKAKMSGKPVSEYLALLAARPRVTAYTLSIDTPSQMAQAALDASKYPILKLKIDGLQGLDACLAVMRARPDAQLIIDANEALTPNELMRFRSALTGFPILMIEQPLKADLFDQIENLPNSLPILCADESLHTRDDLQALWDAGYRAVNVKLDKCGGLTEAHEVMRMAKQMGFVIMAGCMVGSSLAIAPMMLLESYAHVIDLDGPLLLKKDVGFGIKYNGATITPPTRKLWG